MVTHHLAADSQVVGSSHLQVYC